MNIRTILFATLASLSMCAACVWAKESGVILACETYSLRTHLNEGKIDFISVMDLMKQLGIKGIALNDIWMKSYDKAYLQKIKQSARKNGITIVALICEGNLVTANEAARKRQIEENARKMRAAAYLGARVIRFNLGSTGKAEEDATVGVDRAIKAFKELLPLAKKLNLKMTIENHGGVSGTADNIIRIIKSTDPKYVGACLDFKNWPVQSMYEENAKLAPYAYHAHAKSLEFDISGEETTVDYGRILNTLKSAGYNGAISIEYEGSGDEIEGIKKTRDLILKYYKL
ncbi:MAG: sugar phosphate isomerase/epimerase family protein [Armatimonadota bacterium]